MIGTSKSRNTSLNAVQRDWDTDAGNTHTKVTVSQGFVVTVSLERHQVFQYITAKTLFAPPSWCLQAYGCSKIRFVISV